MKDISISNAYIRKIETMADGGLKIVLNTNELPPEEEFALFRLRHDVQKIQLMDVKYDEGNKTPSQRLKHVLYRLWEQNYKETHKSSENFYNEYMEKLINQIKDKLN